MASGVSSNDTGQETEIEKFFKKCLSKESCHEVLNILITGKTGVGKSRLVNALVGRNVTKEGRAKDPCTSEVTCYKLDIGGVSVTVWDSPGLQDGTTNEARYIEDMKRKIKDVALIIYCIKMNDTRFYDGDKEAIRILTEEFGKKLWVNTVVALTFANKVEDPDGEEDELQYFQSQLQEWKRQLTHHFAEVGLNPKVCESIPLIPVGNQKKSMRLPGRENWLSDLWVESCQVMKASARRGMFRITRHQFVRSSSAIQNTVSADGIPSTIPLNEQQEKNIFESLMDAFMTGCKETGKAAGTVVGGTVGVWDGFWKSVYDGVK